MQHSPAWRIALGAAALVVLGGCSRPQPEQKQQKAKPAYFKVDAGTAGTIKGVIRFSGKKPVRRVIDMDQEPECAHLHKGGKVVTLADVNVGENAVVVTKGDQVNIHIGAKQPKPASANVEQQKTERQAKIQELRERLQLQRPQRQAPVLTTSAANDII